MLKFWNGCNEYCLIIDYQKVYKFYKIQRF